MTPPPSPPTTPPGTSTPTPKPSTPRARTPAKPRCPARPVGSSTFSYDTLGDQTAATTATGVGTVSTFDQTQHLRAVAPTNAPANPTATYTYTGDGLLGATATAPPTTAAPGDVLTIFAGNGTAGAPTAGPATSSDLHGPRGTAIDSSGNAYIADTTNNRIEKVTPAGTLSVFAGTGTAGAPTVGAATSSKFNAPIGIAVDSSGNVYIDDYGNSMIEKVTSGGTLSIIAGTGTAGAPTPGPATASKLNNPAGVAVDSCRERLHR